MPWIFILVLTFTGLAQAEETPLQHLLQLVAESPELSLQDGTHWQDLMKSLDGVIWDQNQGPEGETGDLEGQFLHSQGEKLVIPENVIIQ